MNRRHLAICVLAAVCAAPFMPIALASGAQNASSSAGGTGQSPDTAGSALLVTLRDADGRHIAYSVPGGDTKAPLPDPAGLKPIVEARAASSGRAGPWTFNHSVIYDNSGKNTPQQTIDDLGQNFDDIIWPNDTGTFGVISRNSINIKIQLQDGIAGVAGWFAPGDPWSVYLDWDDLDIDLDVLAHEFQHLIHDKYDSNEGNWVNEGCSELGIYVSYGPARPGFQMHIQGYASNTDNDFTQWDVISDYGGAGAYITYIYDHYGKDVIKNLVADPANGITSVNNVLAPKGEGFTSVFKKFIVANWMDDPNISKGEYGYTKLDIGAGYTYRYYVYPSGNGSSQVGTWGADYAQFELPSGQQPSGDLKISFQGLSGGPFYVAVMKIGNKGAGVNNSVDIMSLNGAQNGSMVISNFITDYQRVALAISSLGNGGTYSFSGELIDYTPPITTAYRTPSTPNGKNGWYTAPPTVTLLPNEMGARTYYHWNGDADKQYTGKLTASEGNNTLYFHSVDSSGNVESERSITVAVDTQAPSASAAVTPAQPDGKNGWYTSVPTVTLSPSESGLPAFYMWDGGGWKPYNGTLSAPEGAHTLSFYAEDRAGNPSPTGKVDLKVDTETPGVNLTITPAAPDGQSGWYKRKVIAELISEDSSAALWYWWDAGVYIPYTGPVTAPEGVHTIHYFANDSAGNSAGVGNRELKVDTKIPETRTVTDPAEPQANDSWFNTAPSIRLDSGEEGVRTYFKWDDGGYQAYTTFLAAPEGVHTLFYYSVDAAGNTETEKMSVFKVDTTPPGLLIRISPDAGSNWYRKSPSISFDTEAEARVVYWWDSEAEGSGKSLALKEGVHTLHAYAADKVGNRGATVDEKFRMDSVLPTAILKVSANSITAGGSVRFDGSESSDSNKVASYRFEFGDGNATPWQDSPYTSYTFVSPGESTVTLRVKDTTGLESKPVTVLIAVAAPPQKVDRPVVVGSSLLGTYGIPLLLLVVVVAAIAGAVVVVRRRRRSGRPGAPVKAYSRFDDDSMQTYADSVQGSAFAGLDPLPDVPYGETEAVPAYAPTEPVQAAQYSAAVEAQDYAPRPPVDSRELRFPVSTTPVVEHETSAPPAPAHPQPTVIAAPATTAPVRAPPSAPSAPSVKGAEIKDILSRLDSLKKGAPATADAGSRPSVTQAAPQMASDTSHRGAASGDAAPAQHAVPVRVKSDGPAGVKTSGGPAWMSVQGPELEKEAGPGYLADSTNGKVHTADADPRSGRRCPACGTEMARIVSLEGHANQEKLRSLNAKGMWPFTCSGCGRFDIAPWQPKK